MSPYTAPGLTTTPEHDLFKACIRQASLLYNVSEHVIIAKPKFKMQVEARQYTMYLMRMNAGMSFTKIGKFFDKDHSTVVHACKVIKERIETNQLLVEL